MTRSTESHHPRTRLDELIHHPVRLSIMAALVGVDDAEFGVVRDAVEVSDSVLSRQVSTLEEAGYVKVKKGYIGKRPRTWLIITARGRHAYEGHVAALREIAGIAWARRGSPCWNCRICTRATARPGPWTASV